jgi:S-methylmethionine-dependent homocysteine/selenocysteine methylase
MERRNILLAVATNRSRKNMSRRNIVERLKAGEFLVMDGGTGSELQKRGVNVMRGVTTKRRPKSPLSSKVKTTTGLGVWSASANLDAPEVVRAIHEDYLNAGADILISNNFYTSRAMLSIVGEEDRWEEYTRRGAELAIQARDAVKPAAYVAGGFAPPLSGDLRKEYEGQARILSEAGVDILLAEFLGGDTVHESAIADCVTAAEVCEKTGLPVFLGLCNVTEEGKMQHGESFSELVAALKGHRVDALFLMCSTPEEISACMPGLRSAYDGPIGAYGHFGYDVNPKFGSSPDELYFVIDNTVHTPARYAEFARQWKEMGAQIIGGCCGTGPEHIAELSRATCPH